MNVIYNPIGAAIAAIDGLLASVLPGWAVSLIMALLGSAILAGVVSGVVILLVWLERKIIARMQDRYGPNRVGPFGLLQSVADAVKLLSKEDIIPARVDRVIFILAPILVLTASLMVWAVIPWSPGVVPTDLNVGVLFLLAMGGLPVLGVIMAGWSSSNKYALLGGMRAAAQLVSYEIPGVLAALVPVMLAGTMSLSGIVAAQEQTTWAPNWWFFFTPWGFIAFVIYVIASLAETNRTPFDLIEAESELAAGFHTEYSGMRFALFFLAEYANIFAVSAIAATLFFGGWAGPIPFIPSFGFLPGIFWFLGKTFFMVFVFMWIRSTLPRLRYDQLMNFAWKRLLPLGLFNLGLTAVAIGIADGFLGGPGM
ncbi:MAG: NADH-quinone oxidoreductase subunit NuoH [Chloroflexi bacterium]|nr:NADH-quinone oxidoreductase subunit NuoH [Chloroflexota bacterium]